MGYRFKMFVCIFFYRHQRAALPFVFSSFLALTSCAAPLAGPAARASHPLPAAPLHRAAVAARPSLMTPVSPQELPNFHIVNPSLLRGAAPTPEGLKTLKRMGVRTVIDLRIAPKTVAKEKRQVENLGMQFINLPMSGDPPTSKQVQTFLSRAANPAAGPLFLHCQHGADRTGTMIGIYREVHDHWSFERTYQEMRRYGFNPHWNKLRETVQQYGHQ